MVDEKTEEKTETNSTSNNEGGNIPKEQSIIERADALAKRLEETEKRIGEKMSAYEKRVSENILAGRSGLTAPEKTPEQEIQEQADKIIRTYFN